LDEKGLRNNSMIQKLPDKRGRRSGVERREIFYTLHIPERRSGKDRRSGNDRRKKNENVEIIKKILNGQGQEWPCLF
jgi:hypothetical protein